MNPKIKHTRARTNMQRILVLGAHPTWMGTHIWTVMRISAPGSDMHLQRNPDTAQRITMYFGISEFLCLCSDVPTHPK